MMTAPMPCHHHQQTNKAQETSDVDISWQQVFIFLFLFFFLLTKYLNIDDDGTTPPPPPGHIHPHVHPHLSAAFTPPPHHHHHHHHHHHQQVPVTRWLVFLAFHPPHGPPLPPTSPGDSLVVFSGFPPTTWPTYATNESRWLVGGLFWLSTHHMAHLCHQRVSVTRWLAFLAFHPPRGPPLPPTSPSDSLVVFSGFPLTMRPTSGLLCNKEGSGNENRPRRRQTHRLGHR